MRRSTVLRLPIQLVLWFCHFDQMFWRQTCGLHYKPMTIVNDDSRVVNKLEALLTDVARVFIYDRHMFKVEATEMFKFDLSRLV
jgi:hypothetical protein